jgi:hypothetical protein
MFVKWAFGILLVVTGIGGVFGARGVGLMAMGDGSSARFVSLRAD